MTFNHPLCTTDHFIVKNPFWMLECLTFTRWSVLVIRFVQKAATWGHDWHSLTSFFGIFFLFWKTKFCRLFHPIHKVSVYWFWYPSIRIVKKSRKKCPFNCSKMKVLHSNFDWNFDLFNTLLVWLSIPGVRYQYSTLLYSNRNAWSSG